MRLTEQSVSFSSWRYWDKQLCFVNCLRNALNINKEFIWFNKMQPMICSSCKVEELQSNLPKRIVCSLFQKCYIQEKASRWRRNILLITKKELYRRGVERKWYIRSESQWVSKWQDEERRENGKLWSCILNLGWHLFWRFQKYCRILFYVLQNFE